MLEEQTGDLEVKDHLEYNIKTICAYCGKEFETDENVIEKEIHGRVWRFCSDECYQNFIDAYDYIDDSDYDEDAPREAEQLK